MCMNFIDDPRKWRISMSGFSIKTGWGDEKKIIAKCPVDGRSHEEWVEWMENAELICELHNRNLSSPQHGLTKTETNEKKES